MARESLSTDIVILGHFAKDIIEIDGKSMSSLGGAVYYGGIAGSHMGLDVAIITRLRESDFHDLEVFKKNDVRYFATPSSETSGLKNIYSSENMDHRTYEPLGFAGKFSIEEIPDIQAKYFVIGPIIAGEVDLELLNYISHKFKDKIALDIQGFIRGISGGRVQYQQLSKEELSEILAKVKFLKLDSSEAKSITKQDNIIGAAKLLREFGPSEIIITHKKGISLVADNGDFFYPWKNRNDSGRTGRGDTAFISYLGSRLTKSPKESLLFSAALTSLKMENIHPFSLPLSQVEEFIKKEYKK